MRVSGHASGISRLSADRPALPTRSDYPRAVTTRLLSAASKDSMALHRALGRIPFLLKLSRPQHAAYAIGPHILQLSSASSAPKRRTFATQVNVDGRADSILRFWWVSKSWVFQLKMQVASLNSHQEKLALTGWEMNT